MMMKRRRLMIEKEDRIVGKKKNRASSDGMISCLARLTGINGQPDRLKLGVHLTRYLLMSRYFSISNL